MAGAEGAPSHQAHERCGHRGQQASPTVLQATRAGALPAPALNAAAVTASLLRPAARCVQGEPGARCRSRRCSRVYGQAGARALVVAAQLAVSGSHAYTITTMASYLH
jgi:hypothetical protein